MPRCGGLISQMWIKTNPRPQRRFKQRSPLKRPRLNPHVVLLISHSQSLQICRTFDFEFYRFCSLRSGLYDRTGANTGHTSHALKRNKHSQGHIQK